MTKPFLTQEEIAAMGAECAAYIDRSSALVKAAAENQRAAGEALTGMSKAGRAVSELRDSLIRAEDTLKRIAIVMAATANRVRENTSVSVN